MNSSIAAFANPTILPVRSISTLAASPVLVVAPHPDDETLGCGGTIALLRAIGCEVRVLVMSDGTMSHPRSRQYPELALRDLREQETLAGLAILGVAAAAVTFLRLKDGAVPTLDSPGIRTIVARCLAYLEAIAPQLVILPSRHDPHADHRVTWRLIQTALVYLPDRPRVIEYPIWDWDPTQRGRFHSERSLIGWRIEVGAVLDAKRQAVAQYRSQVSDLIQDDPEGFRLTPDMLENFNRPWEVYYEEV